MKEDPMQLDPLGTTKTDDHNRLFDRFGTQPLFGTPQLEAVIEDAADPHEWSVEIAASNLAKFLVPSGSSDGWLST